MSTATGADPQRGGRGQGRLGLRPRPGAAGHDAVQGSGHPLLLERGPGLQEPVRHGRRGGTDYLQGENQIWLPKDILKFGHPL